MEKFKTLATSRLAVFFGGVVLAFAVAWPLLGSAQDKSDKAKDPGPHAQPKDKQSPGDQNLASQIAELHVKVAKLEAALAKGKMAGMGGAAGMGMMEDDKMMGGMGGQKKAMGKAGMGGGMEDMDKDEMKGMGAMGGGKAGMGGMGMEDMDMMEMMGMMGMAPKTTGGMGGMKSMGKMQMQAALPSFPGASHIYHVGATDFFLNHPEHIDLTAKQKGDLGRLKEKAVLAKTSAQRKIDEAEQELWTLTSADEPDAAKVEAKIQEIEKLRGDQRMTFIRAVGGAAKLLTDEQRRALLGTGVEKTAKPDPHAGHKKP
ncbi:MAG: hypothetical protein K2R98_15035 [Gemmataceae bacterium]|nr:hypothetical protein [Gemmataceae bacterium]